MEDKKYVLKTKLVTGETRYYNGMNAYGEVVRLVVTPDKAMKFDDRTNATVEAEKLKKFSNFIIAEV